MVHDANYKKGDIIYKQRDEANGLSKGECVIGMSYVINGVKYVFDENGYLVEWGNYLWVNTFKCSLQY